MNKNKPKSSLPVYKMKMSDDLDSDLGLSQISLVLSPAIDVAFLTFNKDEAKPKYLKLSVSDADLQICTGPVLIPDLPVLRRENGFEYLLLADSNVIFHTALKYAKQLRNNNVDLEHDGTLVSGVTMFESFITDEKRGIQPPTGFSNLPYGTWFASFKVEDPEIWASIKAGEFSGFSITGLYNLENTGIELDVEQKDKLDPLSIYKDLMNLLDDMDE